MITKTLNIVINSKIVKKSIKNSKITKIFSSSFSNNKKKINFMFNISIWLPIWQPSPYTTGSSQDNHDISGLLASWLPR